MKKKLTIFGILLFSYLISYLIFRNSNIETWDKDGKEYVIFPKSQKWVYYFFRPATYIDNKLTKMQFHIGQHIDNNENN
jgi:hypothetical protein